MVKIEEVNTNISKLSSNLLFGLFFMLTASASCAADYVIGAGDVISVTIFNEADMSLPRTKVPKAGKLSFPLIGDVKVSGVSTKQLKSKLVKKLKDGYLKKPQVLINIEQYRPFFVNGQVKSPGGYPYVDGLTVRKAIAISGGLTDRASTKKISLIAEGKKNSVRIDGSLDARMRPGDVLTIGESMF